MIKLILAACLILIIGETLAANDVRLLRYFNNNDGSGNYEFVFEQSDETRFGQTGRLINEGGKNPYIIVEGDYSWRAPDNELYLVSYSADENGYKSSINKGPGALPPRFVAGALG